MFQWLRTLFTYVFGQGDGQSDVLPEEQFLFEADQRLPPLPFEDEYETDLLRPKAPRLPASARASASQPILDQLPRREKYLPPHYYANPRDALQAQKALKRKRLEERHDTGFEKRRRLAPFARSSPMQRRAPNTVVSPQLTLEQEEYLDSLNEANARKYAAVRRNERSPPGPGAGSSSRPSGRPGPSGFFNHGNNTSPPGPAGSSGGRRSDTPPQPSDYQAGGDQHRLDRPDRSPSASTSSPSSSPKGISVGIAPQRTTSSSAIPKELQIDGTEKLGGRNAVGSQSIPTTRQTRGSARRGSKTAGSPQSGEPQSQKSASFQTSTSPVKPGSSWNPEEPERPRRQSKSDGSSKRRSSQSKPSKPTTGSGSGSGSGLERQGGQGGKSVSGGPGPRHTATQVATRATQRLVVETTEDTQALITEYSQLGWGLEQTSGAGLLCLCHAVRQSIRAQYPSENVPSVAELQTAVMSSLSPAENDIMRKSGVAKKSKDFTFDEAYAGLAQMGYHLLVVAEDPRKGTWVWNNNRYIPQGKERYLVVHHVPGHYSSIGPQPFQRIHPGRQRKTTLQGNEKENFRQVIAGLIHDPVFDTEIDFEDLYALTNENMPSHLRDTSFTRAAISSAIKWIIGWDGLLQYGNRSRTTVQRGESVPEQCIGQDCICKDITSTRLAAFRTALEVIIHSEEFDDGQWQTAVSVETTVNDFLGTGVTDFESNETRAALRTLSEAQDLVEYPLEGTQKEVWSADWVARRVTGPPPKSKGVKTGGSNQGPARDGSPPGGGRSRSRDPPPRKSPRRGSQSDKAQPMLDPKRMSHFRTGLAEHIHQPAYTKGVKWSTSMAQVNFWWSRAPDRFSKGFEDFDETSAKLVLQGLSDAGDLIEYPVRDQLVRRRSDVPVKCLNIACVCTAPSRKDKSPPQSPKNKTIKRSQISSALRKTSELQGTSGEGSGQRKTASSPQDNTIQPDQIPAALSGLQRRASPRSSRGSPASRQKSPSPPSSKAAPKINERKLARLRPALEAAIQRPELDSSGHGVTLQDLLDHINSQKPSKLGGFSITFTKAELEAGLLNLSHTLDIVQLPGSGLIRRVPRDESGELLEGGYSTEQLEDNTLQMVRRRMIFASPAGTGIAPARLASFRQALDDLIAANVELQTRLDTSGIPWLQVMARVDLWWHEHDAEEGVYQMEYTDEETKAALETIGGEKVFTYKDGRLFYRGENRTVQTSQVNGALARTFGSPTKRKQSTESYGNGGKKAKK